MPLSAKAVIEDIAKEMRLYILIQCKRYTDVKIASLKVNVIMKTYQCQVSHNFHEKQFMGMRFLNASNKER